MRRGGAKRRSSESASDGPLERGPHNFCSGVTTWNRVESRGLTSRLSGSARRHDRKQANRASVSAKLDLTRERHDLPDARADHDAALH
jgi:hypothetical protein